MKQFYKNLPVIVTGGAGFIGSNLVHKLVELKANVTVIDNLQTGFLKNLENILDKIIFINGDITNKKTCLETTKNKKIVFHLAAMTSVPETVEYPETCYNTNINGTFNLLEACRLNNVKRFLFSSSAAVYGPCETACTENMPCRPTSPYGTSKLIGELLCKQYAQNYGIKTVCLRYFNVFGKHQNPEGAYAAVVAKFQNQIKENKPITIFGDGLQTRDFISVQKVVEANLTLSMQNKNNMNGSSFNIATGHSITLLELFEQIKKEFPEYEKKLLFKPSRAGDIKHSIANTEKLKTVILKKKGIKNKKTNLKNMTQLL